MPARPHRSAGAAPAPGGAAPASSPRAAGRFPAPERTAFPGGGAPGSAEPGPSLGLRPSGGGGGLRARWTRPAARLPLPPRGGGSQGAGGGAEGGAGRSAGTCRGRRGRLSGRRMRTASRAGHAAGRASPRQPGAPPPALRAGAAAALARVPSGGPAGPASLRSGSPHPAWSPLRCTRPPPLLKEWGRRRSGARAPGPARAPSRAVSACPARAASRSRSAPGAEGSVKRRRRRFLFPFLRLPPAGSSILQPATPPTRPRGAAAPGEPRSLPLLASG